VIWKKITGYWMQVNLENGYRSECDLWIQPIHVHHVEVLFHWWHSTSKKCGKSWRLALKQKKGSECLRVKNKHEIVESQRSFDFLFLVKCFVPPLPKQKEFGHVPDTTGICPGCSGGLSIGYLRLSAGLFFHLFFCCYKTRKSLLRLVNGPG